jgi:hypothetical protein
VGELVLPDFAGENEGYSSERPQHPDSGKGERVDLKGESGPLYTPVFLRLHRGKVVFKGRERKEGQDSYRILGLVRGLEDSWMSAFYTLNERVWGWNVEDQ